MGDVTGIQWTDATWNPVRGCSRISPGCENCYAEKMAGRFCGEGKPFHGFATLTKAGARWTRKVALAPSMIDAPLRWKKPRRIFVNSMSDLFHEDLSPLDIGKVFDVMERCPQHTFQILTKRADVMRDFMRAEYATEPPPRNVWLGVSVEDQQRADERIPHLLDTPAAVRFLSVEPLIGPVDLRIMLGGNVRWNHHGDEVGRDSIHWVIVGGESGPGARPCALEWIERIVEQCEAADVPVFVKQLGAFVVSEHRTAPADMLKGTVPANMRAPNGEAWAWRAGLYDTKGGDVTEWPEPLRVREFPTVNR